MSARPFDRGLKKNDGGWVHLPVLKPSATNAVVSLVYLQLNVLGKVLNLVGHRDTRHACTNTNGSNLLVSRVMQRDVRYHVGRVWSNPFFGGGIVAIIIARSRHCHGRHIENDFDLEKRTLNHLCELLIEQYCLMNRVLDHIYVLFARIRRLLTPPSPDWGRRG